MIVSMYCFITYISVQSRAIDFCLGLGLLFILDKELLSPTNLCRGSALYVDLLAAAEVCIGEQVVLCVFAENLFFDVVVVLRSWT